MKYKKKYQIKQSSPLLQFQLNSAKKSNYEFLRATEVKSKLVRFIDEFCFRNKIKININNKSKLREIIDDKNTKGNFKVQLFLDQKYNNYDIKLYDALLITDKKRGNQGKKGIYNPNLRANLIFIDLDQTINFYGERLIKLIGKNNCSLLEMIDFVLPYFFKFNAFGYRSSKGYGCFELVDHAIDKSKEGYFLDHNYYQLFGSNDTNENIETIDYLYLDIINSYRNLYANSNTVARTRIFLGKRLNVDKMKVELQSNVKIARYASPIKFRIYQDTILIIPTKINEVIKNIKSAKLGHNITLGKELDFDLIKFLDQVMLKDQDYYNSKNIHNELIKYKVIIK